MDPLATLLSSIDERLGKIDVISGVVNSVSSSVRSLTTKFGSLEKAYTNIQSCLVDLTDRVCRLEARDKDTIAGEDLLEKTAEERSLRQPESMRDDTELEIRMLKLETQSLADQLVLTGLPVLPHENLVQTIRSLGEVLHVSLVPSDLISVKRLGKSKTEFGSPQARDVLVKFSSPRLPCDFISGKKMKKELRAGHIDPRLSESPVFLNRSYPPTLYKLRCEVCSRYPEITRKNIWIGSTAVFVRLKDGSEPVRLLPSTGISRLSQIIGGNVLIAT